MGNACQSQIHIDQLGILRQTSDSNSIQAWLRSIQISHQTATIFSFESLDRWTAVLGLENSQLTELDIPLGDKIVLKQEILKLKNDKNLLRKFETYEDNDEVVRKNTRKIVKSRSQKQTLQYSSELSETELKILKGDVDTVEQEQFSRKMKLYFITNGNDMNISAGAM